MPLWYSIEISWPCACKQITSVRPSWCVYISQGRKSCSGMWTIVWECRNLLSPPLNWTLTFFNTRVYSSHICEISRCWFVLHVIANVKDVLSKDSVWSICLKAFRWVVLHFTLYGHWVLSFLPFLMLVKSFSQFNLKSKKFILEKSRSRWY